MKKNIFINFCLRQPPDYGGTYTAQSLFRRTLNSYFIDLKIPSYDNPSEAQYTVPLSTNPLLGYLKSTNRDFFSFIPNEIKNNTLTVKDVALNIQQNMPIDAAIEFITNKLSII